MFLSLVVASEYTPKKISENLKIWLQKLLKNYNLLKKLAYAKSQARSLNHLTILIEKTILGLEIERGETEQKSYIDIK